MAEFMWRLKLNNSDPFETILKDVAEFWNHGKPKHFIHFLTLCHYFIFIQCIFIIPFFNFNFFNFFNIIICLLLNKLIILYLYNVFITMDGGEITNLSGRATKFSLVPTGL